MQHSAEGQGCGSWTAAPMFQGAHRQLREVCLAFDLQPRLSLTSNTHRSPTCRSRAGRAKESRPGCFETEQWRRLAAPVGVHCGIQQNQHKHEITGYTQGQSALQRIRKSLQLSLLPHPSRLPPPAVTKPAHRCQRSGRPFALSTVPLALHQFSCEISSPLLS